MLGIGRGLCDHHQYARFVPSNVLGAVGQLRIEKNSFAGCKFENFGTDKKSNTPAYNVAVFLPGVRHHHFHPILAWKEDVEYFQIVVWLYGVSRTGPTSPYG